MTARLTDRIAIEETKARYCRFLDTKDWDGFGGLFTDDVEVDTTGSGGGVLRGRVALLDMLNNSIADSRTVHQVHSPEMHFIDDDTADVVWAMQDRILWTPERAQTIGYHSLTGWGHYHERYVRGPDDQWRIARQRLSRLFMEMQPVETAGTAAQ